jgi:hypothetical protein
MGLAERCAKMLDEAELRVKQVSDRAVQAGSASLAGLDEEMRGVPSRIGTGEEQLVVEIESYEATFVQVEQPQAEERNSRTAQVTGQQAKAKSAPQGGQARTLESELELDPLFDDED